MPLTGFHCKRQIGLLSRPMCPGERLTLNNRILWLFRSRIETLVPVSRPHRDPFTRYTLLEGVSCGNAILRPSGDGTANNTMEDLSNSHACAPPASTKRITRPSGVTSTAYHPSPFAAQTNPLRFFIPFKVTTRSAASAPVASREMTRTIAVCGSWFGIATKRLSGDMSQSPSSVGPHTARASSRPLPPIGSNS